MEEDFYGDGSADSFISDRQRLMIMKDEARKKNKKVRLADFEKKIWRSRVSSRCSWRSI